MKPRPLTIVLSLALLATLLLPATLLANDDEQRQREREALERMQQRYPNLLEAKNNQHIGETWQGVVELVPDRDIEDEEQRTRLRDMVRSENSDRRTLFGIWARRAGEEVTVDIVAARFRKLQYERSRPKHKVTDQQGSWMTYEQFQQRQREKEEEES